MFGVRRSRKTVPHPKSLDSEAAVAVVCSDAWNSHSAAVSGSKTPTGDCWRRLAIHLMHLAALRFRIVGLLCFLLCLRHSRWQAEAVSSQPVRRSVRSSVTKLNNSWTRMNRFWVLTPNRHKRSAGQGHDTINCPQSNAPSRMPPPGHLPPWLTPTLNCQYCISVSGSGLQKLRSLWPTEMRLVLAV